MIQLDNLINKKNSIIKKNYKIIKKLEIKKKLIKTSNIFFFFFFFKIDDYVGDNTRLDLGFVINPGLAGLGDRRISVVGVFAVGHQTPSIGAYSANY